jgi:hypothetical protein
LVFNSTQPFLGYSKQQDYWIRDLNKQSTPPSYYCKKHGKKNWIYFHTSNKQNTWRLTLTIISCAFPRYWNLQWNFFLNHPLLYWGKKKNIQVKNIECQLNKSIMIQKYPTLNHKENHYCEQLENKQEMKASRFMKWNNCIN